MPISDISKDLHTTVTGKIIFLNLAVSILHGMRCGRAEVQTTQHTVYQRSTTVHT